MAFRAVYDTQEDVPKPLREHFVAGEDGKFRPEVEAVDGYALEDVTGLKSALAKHQSDAKTATGKLKELETELATLTAERDELKANSSTAAEDIQKRIDEVKAQLAESHTKEKDELQTSISTRTSQLETALIENAAVRAMADPEIKGSPDLLLPIVKGMARLEDGDDGKVKVVIYDPANPDVPKMNSKADPMTFTELLTEMRGDPKYAAAFEGANQSGGGMQNTTPSRDGKLTPEQAGKLSPAEYAQARKDGKI